MRDKDDDRAFSRVFVVVVINIISSIINRRVFLLSLMQVEFVELRGANGRPIRRMGEARQRR